jgi:hypothetical protein
VLGKLARIGLRPTVEPLANACNCEWTTQDSKRRQLPASILADLPAQIFPQAEAPL